MNHDIKIVSVSLPTPLVKELDKICDLEHKNRSELYREALRQYIKMRRWMQLREYTAAKASAVGMQSVNIEGLIDGLSEA